MPLSNTFVRQVKHTGAPAGDKQIDGGNMYLLVKALGEYWRLNYRYAGKQNPWPWASIQTFSFLPHARPVTMRAVSHTFQTIGREWLSKTSARGEKTQRRVESWLEKNIFPAIGHLPIAELRPRDILDTVWTIEQCGAIDSAKSVLGNCGQIFQCAMTMERSSADITTGLYRALEVKGQQH